MMAIDNLSVMFSAKTLSIASLPDEPASLDASAIIKLLDFCVPCNYAPNFEKVGGGGILVSACPYVCMYVRTYVCMYSCSRYRLETSCMDSSWKNSRRIFLVFPELSPLVK